MRLWIERLAVVAGVVALATWAALRVIGGTLARDDVKRFEMEHPRVAPDAATPDFQLWSPGRVSAWKTAQAQPSSSTLGVLRVRRLNIEAPILEGTDDWTLNRALGHIDGTPVPGADGNSGIAGHRDSFFRALKDVATGDVLELATADGTANYRVERIWIVRPDEVSVLDPTASPSITLVTCYPFYFVGSAPERFIVRAVRSDAPPAVGLRTTAAG